MYLPALEKLMKTVDNAPTLLDHLVKSHTTTEQVGKIAAAAGVKTLVLSHFVPGGDPRLPTRCGPPMRASISTDRSSSERPAGYLSVRTATMQSAAIPLTLLTGFLGSGKTTLLNRLLPQPALGRCAVVINELGAIGLDHLFVSTSRDETIALLKTAACAAACATNWQRPWPICWSAARAARFPPSNGF
jgi:Putative GTPases (G3E family)